MKDDTPRRGPGRPPTGHDTSSSYRAPAELRQEAAEIAQQRGETLSDVIRRALESYVRRHRRHQPKQIVTDLATGETRIVPKGQS